MLKCSRLYGAANDKVIENFTKRLQEIEALKLLNKTIKQKLKREKIQAFKEEHNIISNNRELLPNFSPVNLAEVSWSVCEDNDTDHMENEFRRLKQITRL